MFYGAQIKPGQSVSPSSEDGGEILHISQICLVETKDDARTLVQVFDGKNTYCVAILQKDKCEHVSVDLFVPTTTGLQFSTKGGKNEVHIVGYFEPDGHEGYDDDDESDNSFMDQLSADKKIKDLDEEDDDDDEEFEEQKSAKKSKSGKLGKDKKNNSKSDESMINGLLDDDDDDDDDEDDDDDDEKYDDEEDDEELDDEEEEKTSMKVDKSKGSSVSRNKQSNETQNKNHLQKRKTPVVKNTESKKQKSEGNTGAGGEASLDNFKNELINYLKANGRTNLGTLGQKVKKPSSIEKLGQYIKEQSSVFKIESGFVSLV